MTSLASAPVMRATSLPASRLWTGRVITGLVVATVVATRPDLVHGAQPLLAERRLETRKVDVS